MKKCLYRFRYELVLFSVFLFELLMKMPSPEGIDRWSVSQYLLTFKLGFSSRMLVGSIINLFTDNITDKVIFYVAFGASIFLCLFVSCILGYLLKKRNRVSAYMKIIVILYIACPASITYLFNPANFGRFDIFLLLISIGCILVSKTKFKWMIPLMCIVAISIHQVYIFTFFPMVIIVLIYNSLSDKMKFQSSKILIITTTFFTICAFLVFQFYKVTKYPDMETLTQAISSYTNITPVSLLSYDYFFNFNDHANLAFKNLRHNIFAGIYTVTILLPLIIGFRFIWHFSSNASSSKNLGGIYRISFFAPLAAVPVFILTIDWGRWFAAVLITQFVLLIYYLANDDENVYLAISSLRERLSLFKPSLYLGILLVFHMLVGRFEAAATLGSADKFIKLFSKLLNILGF